MAELTSIPNETSERGPDPAFIGYPALPTPEFPEIEHRRWVFRHPVLIRITHWINAICLSILLMSGLQIFNAHPSLYWGIASTFDAPILDLKSTEDDPPRGVATIFGREFSTTGILGSSEFQGETTERGFPSWVTLPATQDLSTGRNWHFLFAWIFVLNGAVYLGYGIATGQLKFRIIPTVDQIHHFSSSLWQHLTFKFPQGQEAKRYNVLQKLTYLVVIVILIPLQILAGLTMSPGMNAVAPFLLDLFGGRQSARTVHFVIAGLLVLFVIVHVVMVIVSGLSNNLRAMITGWFVIQRDREQEPAVTGKHRE
jgi:thiosulfate reductase cytochrome b subunit